MDIAESISNNRKLVEDIYRALQRDPSCQSMMNWQDREQHFRSINNNINSIKHLLEE